MTFQEPIKENPADAQGAFEETAKTNNLAIIAEQERQRRQEIDIQNIKERNTAKHIAKAKQPLIIITEDKADSFGNLYKRLNDALPNVPVIFENKAAQQKFERAQFSMMHEFNHRVVGHFAKTDDYKSSPICNEIKKSDCVIVLGKAQPDLQTELDRHGDYISNDTVNLSLIGSMKRPVESWTAWNKNLQQRPSL